jgi:hypothetical protein
MDEDDFYWRLMAGGERVSDIAVDIWQRNQEHEQSPEGMLARMKAHPITGRQPEEALRAYIDRLPKREQEASISDLMSHTQRDGQSRVHESPALVASESQTVGGVSVEEQGSFAASSVGPTRQRAETVPAEKPEPRLCSCGCGETITRSNQKYVNTRHRQRAWVRAKRKA